MFNQFVLSVSLVMCDKIYKEQMMVGLSEIKTGPKLSLFLSKYCTIICMDPRSNMYYVVVLTAILKVVVTKSKKDYRQA